MAKALDRSNSGSRALEPEEGRVPDAEPWLDVDVVPVAGDWSQLGAVEPLVASVLGAFVRHVPGPGASEAVLALSCDAEVRLLNARFRAQDKPTNVLSFPSAPSVAKPGTLVAPNDQGIIQLGDVVMAVETLAREASDLGIPLQHHFQHLLVHGLLHLLGHDHEDDVQADIMERLETRILADLGIDDPYSIADAAAPEIGNAVPKEAKR